MKKCLILLIISSGFWMATANAQGYYYRAGNNPNFQCVNNCQAADYSNTLGYCQERCAYQNTVATTPVAAAPTVNSNCTSTCMGNGGNYPTCQSQCTSPSPQSPSSSPSPNRTVPSGYAESLCQHNCLANGNNTIFCQQQCA